MKKIILFALALIASSQLVSAQDKGDQVIGAAIGLSTSSFSAGEVSSSSTSFRFLTEYGDFVTDRLRIGGSLSYEYSPRVGANAHSLVVGPTAAYYIKLCDRIYYTPQVGLGFAYSSMGGMSGSGLNLNVQFGTFEYRHKGTWGFSLNLMSLNYTLLSFSEAEVTSNDFSFQLGITPTFGVKYYF